MRIEATGLRRSGCQSHVGWHRLDDVVRSCESAISVLSRYARRQNGRVSFTAGVGSAGEVLAALFTNLQIVGDAYAVRPITKNQPIRWMVKAKIFDEILQWCESLSKTQAPTPSEISITCAERPSGKVGARKRDGDMRKGLPKPSPPHRQ